MYGLTLNLPWLVSKLAQNIPESAELTLDKFCPYMTQTITVRQQLDPESMPVFSRRLAGQFAQQQEKIPQLHIFRLQELRPEDGWPLPLYVDHFDGLPPGRVLLQTTDFLRGMGDMILMLPILRAQAKRLAELGICEGIGISCASRFMPLFYGQDFVTEVLPECPSLAQMARYTYTTDFGLSMQRMRDLCGLESWEQTDLLARLYIPQDIEEKWQRFFTGTGQKIFINLTSFDPERSAPDSLYERLRTEFSEAEFYASIYKNNTRGELFPGGPVNLWPLEESFFDMCGIVSQMDIVVTANTGLAHVAAALGKPTIVYFTGTLHGWDDYWPDHFEKLYPTMRAVGLRGEQTEQQMYHEVIRLVQDISGMGMKRGNSGQNSSNTPAHHNDAPESVAVIS